jgi:glycosyltransferase involved in cell wall biosynthesis
MRILWFTNTPSNASLEFGYDTFGGGWISALETLVTGRALYDIGICFFYNGETFKKVTRNNIVYYGVPMKKGMAIKRIIIRHLALLVDEDPYYFDKILDDFKPDLIHVFGTETGYGKILMHKSKKVIFHLQGLVAPYAGAYFPPGFTKAQILLKSNLSSVLRGITFIHKYNLLKKRGGREQTQIKYWKYFAGRTEWDRNYINLINPNAHYFHFEELLRKEFFENEWKQPSKVGITEEIVIGTTINPNLYKGLDLIYKVLSLIKKINVQWKIFGIVEKDILNMTVKRVLKINKQHQNIKFYGNVSAQELIRQLKSCHFYVHPSYIDNSPNSVCEAMMLGMPVLSSSVGGITTLISNNETGFLFNPYDKYDLAGLLINLINNYGNAKEAGSNARLLAIKRHSAEDIVYALDNIYNTIINDDKLITP